MAEAKRSKRGHSGPEGTHTAKLSASHSVLIPEILSNIFSTMDTDDLYSATFVCLSWSELSLDGLWREMDSIIPLLQVLAPMSCDVDDAWSFDHGLADPKWNRFDSYARRIRILEHSDIGAAGIEKIDPESLLHLVSCLPSNHGPLLPNVKELKWAGWCDDGFFPQVLPFVSPSLQSLHIVTEDDLTAEQHMCRTIQGLAGRPDLELSQLNLGFLMSDHPDLPSSTALLLKSQRRLKSLVFSYFKVSSPISIALPALQELRELDTRVDCSDTNELGSFFSDLASGCPLLEVLQLKIIVESVQESSSAIAFKALSPLLRANMMSTLRIDYWNKISLQVEDVVAMGKAWPNLKSLDLSASTPISILPIYASAFPSLHSLTLPFTFPHEPPFDLSTPKFSSLRQFCPSGQPPKEQIEPIAAFLSWVCPACTEILPEYQPTPWSQHWGAIKKTIKVRHRQDAAVSRLGVEH